MKKNYLTGAGIISAFILVAMFVTVFFIKSPLLFLFPVITVDPITNSSVDGNNNLVMTGKTNLGGTSTIQSYVYPVHGSLSPENGTEKPISNNDVWIVGDSDGWDIWKGTINLTPLEPGEYRILFKTIRFDVEHKKLVESDPVTTFRFTLGNDSCTGDCIRKKEVVQVPYIRINPVRKNQKEMEISGITSLAPGTPLAWRMAERKGKDNASPVLYEGNCTTVPGIEGVNRWMFQPGISVNGTGPYRITVSGERKARNDQMEKVSGSLESGSPGDGIAAGPRTETIPGFVNNTSDLLTIDAIPEMRTDEVHVISGTTSLPPGEVLCVEISPPNLEFTLNFTFNPKEKTQGGILSGEAGCIGVEKGNGKENLWAFNMQTYSLLPGRYEVHVSNSGFDHELLREIPGTASCSGEFTVREGSG
ncbi:hypothetical protein [Methanospirillum lacunae]|uniref:DUF3821 domain-containing protein n=1 Tax=Methanospirillum lacunae TaxID=668570 RepID=A0A2V2N632_9EURY|nr:hypothetical protein [Methanospirillum lacunae]PWR71687.1 hypothetical protein DK846_12645 [Methanospirillum lacunae]